MNKRQRKKAVKAAAAKPSTPKPVTFLIYGFSVADSQKSHAERQAILERAALEYRQKHGALP